MSPGLKKRGSSKGTFLPVMLYTRFLRLISTIMDMPSLSRYVRTRVRGVWQHNLLLLAWLKPPVGGKSRFRITKQPAPLWCSPHGEGPCDAGYDSCTLSMTLFVVACQLILTSCQESHRLSLVSGDDTERGISNPLPYPSLGTPLLQQVQTL